jgi:putative flippase GtrA
MKFLGRPNILLTPLTIKHIKQLFYFGTVGTLSTLLNSVIFITLVNFFKIPPLLSNLLAFLSAFMVSYFGHSWLTFGKKSHSVVRLVKFLMIALGGLAVNSGFVGLLMHILHQSAYIAILPMIFITPLLMFFINKYWVFKDSNFSHPNF